MTAVLAVITQHGRSYSNGTLTISGTGEIYDGAGENAEQPWYDLKDNIKSVIINCGITNIPHGAFTDYTNLTSISLPNSIERIESAFHGCSKLADVSIPNSCKYLARWALDGTKWYDNQPDGVVYCGNFLYSYKGTMPSNTSINVKNGTVGISASFWRQSNLVNITFPDTLEYILKSCFFNCSGLYIYTTSKKFKKYRNRSFFLLSKFKKHYSSRQCRIHRSFSF